MPADDRWIRVAAVGAPLGPLTYRLPAHLSAPHRGARLRVPLGPRRVTGFYLGEGEPPPEGVVAREILSIVEAEAAFPETVLELCLWTSDYYLAAPGEVLQLALPPRLRRGTGSALGGGRPRTKQRHRLATRPDTETMDRLTRRAPVQAKVLERLVAEGVGNFVAGEVLAALAPSATQALRRLEEQGWVRTENIEVVAGDHHVLVEPDRAEAIRRTPAQEAALDAIREERNGDAKPILLLGVTGSGKTEVYLAAVEETLADDRTALVLVPEIALTPLVLGRFRKRFGVERVAVLHSGLSDRERAAEWLRVREGRAPVVVGTRLALFAPLERVGLIVVDEEHELSYKQASNIRYHARDLAIVRARLEGCPVVLGSATPSGESYLNVERGRYRLVELRERVAGASLPTIEVVDLRSKDERIPGVERLSKTLLEAVQATVERHEQALLFLNRRGWAPNLTCTMCGAKPECPSCSVTLTVHRRPSMLCCHYCGHRAEIPSLCPKCESPALARLGAGTQRIEDDLSEWVAGARIARLDRDAAGDAAQRTELLASMARGEVDVLVGTQMVAKGHDFPSVTLAAVLAVDGLLSRADFRAVETAFQLLVQVAGRSGRAGRPGRVLVQSFDPEHPLFDFVRRNDVAGFLDQELGFRRAARFPPYVRLVSVGIEGLHEDRVEEDAAWVADQLKEAAQQHRIEGVDVLGPAPAAVERVQNRHRRRVVLKSTGVRSNQRVVCAALGHPPRSKAPRGSQLIVDVDPGSLL